MPNITKQNTSFKTMTERASQTVTLEPPTKKIGVTYTWDEVSKHQKDNDCWMVIKGKVYDVSSWVDKHPGGRLILNGSGRDATALFMSYHPLSTEKVLPKFEIGEIEDYNPYYQWDSQFYTVLKSRVERFIKDNGLKNNSPFMYLKTLLLICFWVAFYYLAVIRGYSWAVIPFGFIHSHWGISVSHDALHGAYSSSKLLNWLGATTMDLMGGSGLIWMHQHNIGHHPNCNRKGNSKTSDFEFDPDAQSGAPLVRLAPNQPLRWYHRFQFLYIWLLFPFVTGKWAINDVKYILKRKYGEVKLFQVRPQDYVTGLGTKLLFLFYILAIPLYLHDPVQVMMRFVLFMGTVSYNFVLMFAVNHLTEDTVYPDESFLNRDWAKLQALTSTNYAVGSFFWTTVSGGLNYQIEHHLFPSLCHVYLPSISPIVQQTFEEYKVPYQSFPSYSEALVSYIRHLYHLGNPHSDEKQE